MAETGGGQRGGKEIIMSADVYLEDTFCDRFWLLSAAFCLPSSVLRPSSQSVVFVARAAVLAVVRQLTVTAI